MNDASEEPTFEFDIAVSFAGEDREFVEQVVNRLKEAGVRVFYDTDYQPEMWGEDLIEYLDEIYRVKARYALMFISCFYADKMWTRHERRSALARALEQRTTYVLPIRLDSTTLDGLRPTVGYLDARQVGVNGIVNATLAKLTGLPLAPVVAIERVPRTEAERQQVLLMRPPAWEFLYFAGQLLHERNSIEVKYRDHEIGYSMTTGEVVQEANISNYMRQRADDAMELMAKLNMLVNDAAVRERAFGISGQSGNPERLAHLAKRWNSIYEEFMDWAASLRGVSAPSEYRKLLILLARYMNGPIDQYRQFVDEFVTQVDAIPAIIASGTRAQIEISLALSIPDDVTDACHAELGRIISNSER